jgi:GT2 family glycosyltransferase
VSRRAASLIEKPMTASKAAHRAAAEHPSRGPRRWLGGETPFSLAPTGDDDFPERLVLPGALGGWIVLAYSAEALAAPARPVLKILRTGGEDQILVLPGATLGRAFWLGLIPEDATDIHVSLPPGTVLDRVGRRSDAAVLLHCLLRRPGHAFAALYARAKGRPQRARDILRGGLAVTRAKAFTAWAADRAVPYRGPVPTLTVRCVVLTGLGEDEALGRTLASLERQSRPPTVVVLRDHGSDKPPAGEGAVPAEAWNPATRPAELLADADALCLLRAGDELAPDALALLAAGLGEADLAYADEIGTDGLPRLKPDWSPDLALATGYVGRAALLSRKLIARLPDSALGPFAEAGIALEAAVSVACRGARHIPRPLGRMAAPAPSALRPRVLERVLEASGHPARVESREGVSNLRWSLPDPAPLVSVVIPSRDRLDLIGPACRDVLERTDYPAIELIVVDNGSVDPAVLSFYGDLTRDPRARVLPYAQEFNFAAMVNAGVDAASGQVIVLLNNDVGVRQPGWLDAMVRQALRPEVGAVGAKLLFGDGKLQHVGVVVGLSGRAGHILRRRPAETPGRLGQLRVAHEVSAVTAACLAVSRDKYRAVGGFDAEAFPVDFNDVDFCLRLAAAGWKCVWTPAAELFHFESISRGPSVGAKRERFEREAARFTERWLPVIRHDPYYHPALSLTAFGEDLE